MLPGGTVCTTHGQVWHGVASLLSFVSARSATVGPASGGHRALSRRITVPSVLNWNYSLFFLSVPRIRRKSCPACRKTELTDSWLQCSTFRLFSRFLSSSQLNAYNTVDYRSPMISIYIYIYMHRRRSSFNFGRQNIFARKYMREKLTKCPNFTWHLPEKYVCRFLLEGRGGGKCLSPVSQAYWYFRRLSLMR